MTTLSLRRLYRWWRQQRSRLRARGMYAVQGTSASTNCVRCHESTREAGGVSVCSSK